MLARHRSCDYNVAMARAARLLVAALVVMLSSAAAAAPVSAVVERVVAVIRTPAAAEARVVTLTKVEEEARIALVSRGAVLAATQPLDAAALRAGLEWLIDQTLLGDEAARLQVFEIERAEVLAELARFKARFARAADYPSFLARCDLSEEELAAVLRRTLRARRYVESRLSRAGRVSESDVTAWMEAHPRELLADREAARAAVRAALVDERLRDEVKGLVRDLRARADVRVLYDFGPGEEAGGPKSRPNPEG